MIPLASSRVTGGIMYCTLSLYLVTGEGVQVCVLPKVLGELGDEVWLLLLHVLQDCVVGIADLRPYTNKHYSSAATQAVIYSHPLGFLSSACWPLTPGLTVLQFLQQLLLHLQQEVVVVLHFLRGVHHERADQVGAVRLVADAHRARDGTKVHVVLVTGGERGEGNGVRDHMTTGSGDWIMWRTERRPTATNTVYYYCRVILQSLLSKGNPDTCH